MSDPTLSATVYNIPADEAAWVAYKSHKERAQTQGEIELRLRVWTATLNAGRGHPCRVPLTNAEWDVLNHMIDERVTDDAAIIGA